MSQGRSGIRGSRSRVAAQLSLGEGAAQVATYWIYYWIYYWMYWIYGTDLFGGKEFAIDGATQYIQENK